jgi:hypothetical protein
MAAPPQRLEIKRKEIINIIGKTDIHQQTPNRSAELYWIRASRYWYGNMLQNQSHATKTNANFPFGNGARLTVE